MYTLIQKDVVEGAINIWKPWKTEVKVKVIYSKFNL